MVKKQITMSEEHQVFLLFANRYLLIAICYLLFANRYLLLQPT
jgi:hypothetical protein